MLSTPVLAIDGCCRLAYGVLRRPRLFVFVCASIQPPLLGRLSLVALLYLQAAKFRRLRILLLEPLCAAITSRYSLVKHVESLDVER
jgi:hypothetical protein